MATARDMEFRLLRDLRINPETVRIFFHKITPSLFADPRLRLAYNCMCQYLDEAGVPPTSPILAELMAREGSLRDAAACEAVIASIFVGNPGPEDNPSHIPHHIQVLEMALQQRILENRMGVVLGKMEEGDFSAAIKIFQDGLQVVEGPVFHANLMNDILTYRDKQEDIRKHPERHPFIKLGFPSMDEATGGLGRSELCVVLGGVGTGKSLILGQIAVNTALAGYRVLFVTIENDLRSYQGRLYSCLSGVEYKKLKHAQETKEDEGLLLEALNQAPPNFCLELVHYPEECSAKQIADYARTFPYEFDLIIVDQLTNMRPNKISQALEEFSWKWYTRVSVDLKHLSSAIYRGRGIPVITATQAILGKAKDKEKGASKSVDDIAFAKAISHIAHAVIYNSRTDEGAFEMGMSKWRDAYFPPFQVHPHFQTWSVSENPNGYVWKKMRKAPHAMVPLESGPEPKVDSPPPGAIEIPTDFEFPSLDLGSYPEPEAPLTQTIGDSGEMSGSFSSEELEALKEGGSTVVHDDDATEDIPWG